MMSPRTGSPRRPNRRRWSLLAGAAVLGLVPATGCQVEYAGMTLPSGKYMRDDVQYFPPGPDFPWANTQAATQRARMRAMGIEPPPVGTAPVAPGMLDPSQMQYGQGGRATDVNMQPRVMPQGGIPAQPVPVGVQPPPGGVPAPPPPGAPAGPQ